MITTDINYPSSLPWPVRDGYETRSVQTFLRTEMVSGRARQRRRFTSVPSETAVTWIFNKDSEAAAFEIWFKESIKDGAEWFNCPLKTPVGEKHYVCRFTSMYTGPDLVGLCAWRVTATLELWERPLIDPGWGILPDFVAGMDIFDIAMNREWPLHDDNP